MCISAGIFQIHEKIKTTLFFFFETESYSTAALKTYHPPASPYQVLGFQLWVTTPSLKVSNGKSGNILTNALVSFLLQSLHIYIDLPNNSHSSQMIIYS